MPSAMHAGEPASASPAEDAVQPSSDVAADAALVLAAVSRLQAAAHRDRQTLTKLGEALGQMADSIAQAKATLFAALSDEQQPDIAALLDQLEHHVDAMLATAGAEAASASKHMPDAQPPAAAEATPASHHEPNAESDEVPTVSGVVLGRGSSEPIEDASQETATDPVPSVAMLKAMVEALSASVSDPPQPSAPTEAAAPTDEAEPALAAFETEPPAPELPLAQDARPEPEPVVQPEAFTPDAQPRAAISAQLAEAELPEAAAPEPARPIQPVLFPAVPMEELLASYERMEARPIPPPDEGLAVIFTPRSETSSYTATGGPLVFTAATVPEVASAPAAGEPVILAETPEPVVVEAPVANVVTPPAAVAAMAALEIPAEPLAALAMPDLPGNIAAETPTEPAAHAAPAVQADPEFDPTDFLFGPDPEPDPAAFLLEPSSELASESIPPPTGEAGPAPMAAPPEAGLDRVSTPQPGENNVPMPRPEIARDPLAPLKALSEAERIAVFS